MKKNLLPILFAAIMSIVGTNAFAYDIEVENDDGKPIYYVWTNNKTELSVTHCNYSAESYSGDVIIPETVNYNGKKYSVTSIEEMAFFNGYLLGSVTIPNSVKSIGMQAFYECSYLESITIGNSVKSIGECAFQYCRKLASVMIPNSVTDIGDLAFNGCSGLTSVTIGNNLTSIGEGTFEDCSSLTSITISNSVKSIGRMAFLGCSSLTSVTIGNSVTSIEFQAFLGCSSLSSLTIPKSVTSIGESTFYDCSGLTSIVVEEGNTKYDSRNNCNAIIETSSNALIAGCKNTTIPNSVKSIGNFAFRGCIGLISVTIPDNVTSIGECAFDRTSLTSVTIPNSVKSIGEAAFGECTDLTFVTIGNSVTSIGYAAFGSCSSLIDIYCLANNVPNTNTDAFRVSNMENATLHVPTTSVAKYKNAGPWKGFKMIVGIGDVNGDRVLDQKDLNDIISHVIRDTPTGFIEEAADVNGDGMVNVLDIVLLINMM